jgi:hypothetical protein
VLNFIKENGVEIETPPKSFGVRAAIKIVTSRDLAEENEFPFSIRRCQIE